MRDITLEETAYFNFTTRSFSTGVPTVLAGTPVLSVLESNNVTPITAGVSVSVDRASVVGLNQATVVATAANGYEAGKSYAVYISTGTVGGVSVVGEVVAQFTVQAAAAFTRLGAPAGASVSADVAAVKVDTAAIKTKTDFLPSATAGSAGGVFIAGTNASLTITGVTTFTGATVHTGNVSMAAGLTITQSVLNTSALAITGNGSGHGMITAGGATGSGLVAQGNGSGRGGMEVYGVVGPGLYLEGGSGADGHGILVQGGLNGDGLKAVGAGTGVPIRGNITGNITGTITTATNLTTNNDKTGYAIGVGGIAATAFAAGAIDNAAIAADAIGSSELAQTAAREIADEVLDRDLAGGASGGSRNVRNALRSLRNKAAIAAGTLTVYQEDDTTSAWTAVVATTAGNPISSIDPA